MATLRKAKASLLALIFLVNIVSFSGLVDARPIAMDRSNIEGYHDNSLPGSTEMPAAWGGTRSSTDGTRSSTDGTVGSWDSGLGTSDTGDGNGSPSTLADSGRASTPNNPADSNSSKVSESTKRSTTTEPVTGGGNTENGVNGGATNTGTGTNVNVIMGAADGAEKDKGLVEGLLGKLGSIVKTLR